MSKPGNYLIPFDHEGNQLHWTAQSPGHVAPEGRRGWGYAAEWRENAPFTDTLTFDTYSRARSAAYFHFKRTDGTGVCMFLTDAEQAIPRMVKGRLMATFVFRKRGENYGIQIAGEA